MNRITTRQFNLLTDVDLAWDFLVEVYDANHVEAPYFEYAITEPWMNKDYLHLGPFRDREKPEASDWNPHKAYLDVQSGLMAPPPHSTYEHNVIIANEAGEYVCPYGSPGACVAPVSSDSVVPSLRSSSDSMSSSSIVRISGNNFSRIAPV